MIIIQELFYGYHKHCLLRYPCKDFCYEHMIKFKTICNPYISKLDCVSNSNWMQYHMQSLDT